MGSFWFIVVNAHFDGEVSMFSSLAVPTAAEADVIEAELCN